MIEGKENRVGKNSSGEKSNWGKSWETNAPSNGSKDSRNCEDGTDNPDNSRLQGWEKLCRGGDTTAVEKRGGYGGGEK